MAEAPSDTPMARQYKETKAKLSADTILLFRLGDFFEMFDEDAKVGSNILGLTLTARHERPMAGIPAHSVDGYIRRLLEAGKKVAICDQLEAATPGKLVKRELTRIFTPGTALNAEHLEAKRNSYLVAVHSSGHARPTLKGGATNVSSLRDSTSAPGAHSGELCASWLDLSTGEWNVACAPAGETGREGFLNFLVLLQPSELIVPEEGLPPGIKEHLIEMLPGLSCSSLSGTFFEAEGAKKILCEALGVATLKGFGLADNHPGVGAAGALYSYAKQALCGAPANLRQLRLQTFENRLQIDPNTARQLEIFKDLSGGKEGSLIRALDSTMTSAGTRLLERVLLAPACDKKTLETRYAAVEAFAANAQTLKDLREGLGNMRDLERILGRLQNRLRSPKELAATRDTLRVLPGLKEKLRGISQAGLAWIVNEIGEHVELCKKLAEALEEEPNNDLTVGGYIRQGYDAELDRLKSLSANHKLWIAELERTEQERTGIKSLKVKYNNNFGFFIEVTKANLARVPADYIRKSTTVNGERYLTTALQERQKEILGAQTNAIHREIELFNELVAQIIAQAEELRRTAQAISWCDLLSSFAYNALKWNYCRPEILEGKEDNILEIVSGRHAVVEQALVKAANAGERFVPNDTRMSAESEQILLITGPNMAGKSTYIRQVALIVIMAQIGSWVSATSAKIGLVDKLFSRIGSSDALSRGESTFMVEMTETAYILRSATEKSLVILDEIGRGTSTYDGLSIAWACVEYLHAAASSGPRTLFATHYHEMTQLEKTLPRLRNYTVAVKEWGNKIIFVRQVIPGTADRSYGIHVAQLAGLPAAVIDRAGKLLEGLEAQAKAPKNKAEKKSEGQGELF